MEISERLARLLPGGPGGDDGWGVYYRARALAEAGTPVTMLTIGEHDVPTDRAILDAMDRAARAGATGYAPVPGLPALRDAVAARVAARTGVPTARENVLITPGGQAALFAAHLAALAPGQAGLFVSPHYATYPGTVRGAGGRDVAVPASAESGFLPDAAAIRAAASAHGAGSLLINTPNNPTGRVYPRAVLEDLARACRETGLWLISDEVYESQVWQGQHVSPRALPGMAEHVLVVGSMSKSHAMTGSRLGWIVGPERAVAALADLATHTTYGVPGFIQEAALWALTDGGAALEAQVAEPFRRRRALVESALGPSPTLVVLPMEGGMYAFVDVRATGLTGTAFAEALLEAERIAVMPGESFGAAASGHVRIALTAADPALSDALGRLRAFAEAAADSRRPAPAGRERASRETT
jgi:arginine:pyruvate transaminase